MSNNTLPFCTTCGNNGHWAPYCQFARCENCGSIGHGAEICRPTSFNQPPSNQINTQLTASATSNGATGFADLENIRRAQSVQIALGGALQRLNYEGLSQADGVFGQMLGDLVPEFMRSLKKTLSENKALKKGIKSVQKRYRKELAGKDRAIRDVILALSAKDKELKTLQDAGDVEVRDLKLACAAKDEEVKTLTANEELKNEKIGLLRHAVGKRGDQLTQKDSRIRLLEADVAAKETELRMLREKCDKFWTARK
jgi:hypothetical protein